MAGRGERARRALLVIPVGLAILAAAACSTGTGGGSGADAGATGRGGSCSKQDDCFACRDCRQPYDEVCLSGECWLSGEQGEDGDPAIGSYLLIATLDGALDNTRVSSAAVRIYHAERTDGSALTCASLLADPVAADTDETLNLLRSLEPALVLAAGSNQSEMGFTAAVGDARVVLARLHEQSNGQGILLAVGCLEAVDIELGAACMADDDCDRREGCETTGLCGPKRIVVETLVR